MRSKIAFPRVQFMIGVTRGRVTKYFYGEKLKDALKFLRPGESFWYVKFTRRNATFAEFNGASVVTWG